MGNGHLIHPAIRLTDGMLLLSLLLLSFGGCAKNEKKMHGQPEGSSGQSLLFDASEKIATLQRLQERIIREPNEIRLRQQLLQESVNLNDKKMYATGLGKPPEAASSALAQQSAERAAFLDGCRWLAYVQAWRQDLSQPAFGAIQGSLAQARVIHKNVTPEQVTVLVESDF